jgi:hypothetical protein
MPFYKESDWNQPPKEDPIMAKVNRIFGKLLMEGRDRKILTKVLQATGQLGPNETAAGLSEDQIRQKMAAAAGACVNMREIAEEVAKIDPDA